MIPKQAIEKAIEGGWVNIPSQLHWQHKALDPTFWQALGKALGFGDYGKDPNVVAYDTAQDFYRLIYTGGSTDEFWADILK